MRRQCRKIVGIMIHLVPVACLCGPSVAAAVVGYDAIAGIEEEHHLRVPVIGRKRPTMAEYDRLTFTPVLVVNGRSVFGPDLAHVGYSLIHAKRGPRRIVMK